MGNHFLIPFKQVALTIKERNRSCPDFVHPTRPAYLTHQGPIVVVHNWSEPLDWQTFPNILNASSLEPSSVNSSDQTVTAPKSPNSKKPANNSNQQPAKR